MSHYFNVEKKKEITFVNFVIFCMCMRVVKNKFAVSRKTHETKTQ